MDLSFSALETPVLLLKIRKIKKKRKNLAQLQTCVVLCTMTSLLSVHLPIFVRTTVIGSYMTLPLVSANRVQCFRSSKAYWNVQWWTVYADFHVFSEFY